MAQEYHLGHFHEGETQVPVFYLVTGEGEGLAVALADIDTAVMTLVDQDDAVINGRDGQDVKNTNDVEIDETTGKVTWRMKAGDTTRATSADTIGEHDARIVFTLHNEEVLHVHLPYTVGQGPH